MIDWKTGYVLGRGRDFLSQRMEIHKSVPILRLFCPKEGDKNVKYGFGPPHTKCPHKYHSYVISVILYNIRTYKCKPEHIFIGRWELKLCGLKTRRKVSVNNEYNI